ncbi:MAG TPA: hypothetical protein VGC00_14520 [Thermoanaerobaculia bacterium]
MHRVFGSTGLALVIAVGLAAPASADHSWADYHWARTTSSFDLKVVDSTTIEWEYAFNRTLDEWGQSTKLNNVVAAVAEDSRTRKRCQAVSGQMRVCNAAYGQNGWLGLASINIDSNHHITQGVAKMNDSYDWYYAQNPGEDNHVMCQEVGHVYGLGHTSEDGSSQGTCMDYSSSLQSQWPNQHDYEQLDTIYGHLDSYNSYDTSGGGGGGGGCNAPPGKGCNKFEAPDGGVPAGAIRVHYRPGRDGKLGHADYVMPDDKGGLWLFHLTLVPEDARREK